MFLKFPALFVKNKYIRVDFFFYFLLSGKNVKIFLCSCIIILHISNYAVSRCKLSFPI